jgi:hypothetical protein
MQKERDMKVNANTRWTLRLFSLFSLLGSLMFPGGARAANVAVDCSGQTPGAFTSVQAALDSLDVTGPHTIVVTGMCTENISIFRRQHIAIFSPSGQTATISAANTAGIVVHIFASQDITLANLVLQGGGTGLLVNEGSGVQLQNSTIQNNSGAGVGVQIGSVLTMDTSNTIQNNGGAGLFDNSNSSVTVSTLPGQQIKILSNRGSGITIDGSYLQVNFGSLDVENNGGAAIQQTGGRLRVFGGQSANVFQGNGVGINIFNSGSATFSGKNTIRNNGEVGLQILGSSVAFNGSVLSDGTLNATVIERHSILGVNVVRMGELTMSGPHQVQNNGDPAADSTLRGGIRLVRSSVTLAGGADVSNNIGPGIRADQNSGFLLTNVTVNGNTEQGVLVGRQSVGGFTQPLSIAGNGAASVACDTTSLLFGDLSGIDNLDCKRIERSQGPPRAGTVHD